MDLDHPEIVTLVCGPVEVVGALLNPADQVDFSQIMPVPFFMRSVGSQHAWKAKNWETGAAYRTEKHVRDGGGRPDMMVRFRTTGSTSKILKTLSGLFPETPFRAYVFTATPGEMPAMGVAYWKGDSCSIGFEGEQLRK